MSYVPESNEIIFYFIVVLELFKYSKFLLQWLLKCLVLIKYSEIISDF